jgi:hypothetical protein
MNQKNNPMPNSIVGLYILTLSAMLHLMMCTSEKGKAFWKNDKNLKLKHLKKEGSLTII